MKLKYLFSPTNLIRAGGCLVVAALYITWLMQSGASTWGKALGFLSAALFVAVCWPFVPRWVESWDSRCELNDADTGTEPPNMGIAIFACALGSVILTWALVYLLRGLMGHGWELYGSLQFWTGTDSRHYLDIARDWYISFGDYDRMVQLVFLPGYPLAIRLMHILVDDWLLAGMLVSAFCFAGAAVIFYRLARLDMSHSAALTALVFLLLTPGAFFFAAPMSESLFLLLSLGCVYLARRKLWLPACILGACAAFTRSLGMALFVPLLFEMVACAVRGKGGRRFARLGLLLLIPAGFGVYCYINYLVAGDPFKYMEYQSKHWSQNLGLFFNTAAYQFDNAVGNWSGNKPLFWGLWLPNLISAFASLIIMCFGSKHLRPGYSAYFIAYFVVAIGATWLLSAPRYILVLFSVPMALGLISEKRPAILCMLPLWLLGCAAYLLAFTVQWQVW